MSTETNQTPSTTPSEAPASAAPANNGPSGGYRGSGGNRGQGGNRGSRGGNRGRREEEKPDDGIFEKVVFINRCAKVVKGGRRFSFSALVVVGDRAGKIGVGYGKANEVPESIRKGSEGARRNLEPIKLKGDTIPHEVLGEADGGKVLLRPRS